MDFITDFFPRFTRNTAQLITPRYGGRNNIHSERYRLTDSEGKYNGMDYFFIQYTLSRKGVFETGGRRIVIESGKAFICVNTRPYLYYFDKKEASHWDFIWLGMNGIWGQRIFEDIQDKHGSVVSLAGESLSVRMIFDLLDRSKHRRGLNGQSLSIAGYSFILQFLEDIGNKGQKKRLKDMDRAEAYLHDHMNDPVDVNHLALLTGFSKEHFARMFKMKYGVPPAQYLLNIRLEQARMMLKATDLSLDKIAQACGLSDANYLCRLFRRHFGVTPTTYRL